MFLHNFYSSLTRKSGSLEAISQGFRHKMVTQIPKTRVSLGIFSEKALARMMMRAIGRGISGSGSGPRCASHSSSKRQGIAGAA